MEHKGYLSADGTVTRTERPDTVGHLGLRTTRYNLRRVYVTRTWVAVMNDGERYEGSTRAEAIWLATGIAKVHGLK